MPRIGIVILAAGASARMGRPKQALPYGDGTLLSETAAIAHAAHAEPLVVVTGASAGTVPSLLTHTPVICVHNPDWAEGINTSIRAGIAFLETQLPPVDAAILLTCDQPFLTADLIQALITERAITGRTLVASAYADTFGIPAIFDSSLFAKLKALPPGAGAKRLIANHPPDQIATVPFEAGSVDIDTPEEYARLMENRVP